MPLDAPYPRCHIRDPDACGNPPIAPRHPADRSLRIILADDHPVVLMGMEMVLSGPVFSVVAKAQNTDELIELLKREPCDLVISDYSMPDCRFPDGLTLMSYLKRHHRSCSLMVITMLRNASVLQAMLNAGVDGLFDKCSPLGNLPRAAMQVIRGHQHVCPAFRTILETQTDAAGASASLSARELEVVRLFVRGLSGRQIAAQLNRSEKTISRQKRTAMDKLGLEHDSGLPEFARLNGLSG